MLQWGDRWCDIDNRGQPMLVKHNPCGELLHAEVRCDQCDGQLRAHEVRFTLGGEDAPHPPQL
jgi:hypothetical protein